MIDLRTMRPWEQPEITGIGRLPSRPPIVPEERSSLDGEWEFELFPDPDGALDRIEELLEAFDGIPGVTPGSASAEVVSGAQPDAATGARGGLAYRIPVPSNWTRQGFDKPHYTNVVMPWPEPPPHLPENNPTGIYRRTFSVSPRWEGRRLILRIGGAESVAVVWVNGVFVGLMKDSRLESEFDITSAVNKRGIGAEPAAHDLLVMVVRYSDGSYLEDQDHWWMAGLHRGVLLYATEAIYLQDLSARPILAEDHRSGSFMVDIELGRARCLLNRADAGTTDADDVLVTASLYAARRYDGFRESASLGGGRETPDPGGTWAPPAAESSGDTHGRTIEPEPEETPIVIRSARISGVYGSEGILHESPTGGHRVRLEIPVSSPVPWSSESPALYMLQVALEAVPSGEPFLERDHLSSSREPTAGGVHRILVGLRSVVVRDRQLLINGEPVMIRGVNRHEHDPRDGKVVTRESMIADLALLKQFNFNAVRTAHYPNHPLWYDLCDRYGIYLVDEANIEAHQYYNEVCRDPSYAAAFLDRCMRMVLRDRNHPSIIMWSLGNESGYGPNHDASAGWIRHADPSRPLHYEGAIRGEWGQRSFHYHRGGAATDVLPPMYAPVEEIVAWAQSDAGRADPRPLIMCEYCHAMGNSNGGLEDYVAAFRSIPGLQGGFIWDWVDQGLEETAPNGRRYWAYGGDYGDEPNDRDFCINGLVWPDRTPHPAMWEFHKLMQPVALELRLPESTGDRTPHHLGTADATGTAEASGTIHADDPPESGAPLNPAVIVRNEYSFSTLREAVLRWELARDGYPEASGAITLDTLAPRQEVLVPITAGIPASPGEIVLTARIHGGSVTDLVPVGHPIAWEQWRVAGRWSGTPRTDGGEAPTAGDDAAGALNRRRAVPLRLRLAPDGQPVLTDGEGATCVVRGPVTALWRAPTDNDWIRTMPERSRESNQPARHWFDMGLDRLLSTWSYEDGNHLNESAPVAEVGTGVAGVHRAGSRTGDPTESPLRARTRLTLSPPDDTGFQVLEVTIEVMPEVQDLPRVGVRFDLPGECSRLEWYGYGPQENYPDRANGYPLGLWHGDVAEQYVPYTVPQEHGGHGGTRYLSLTGGSHRLIVAAAPGESFQFSALNTAPEDLDTLTHTWQVVPREETILIVDHFHRGLGTATAGPDCAARYRRGAGRYQWKLRLRYDSIEEDARQTD